MTPRLPDSPRLLTPHYTGGSSAPGSPVLFSPKRSRTPKHNFVVPIISLTTPASDDGHGALGHHGSTMSDSEDDGDDVPLSHRRPHDGVSRGSRSHSRSDSLPIDQAVERSNSLKRAQKQVSKAQRILGDNINNLEKRSDSLGEGTISFRHVSGSRRKNLILWIVIGGFFFSVVIVVIVIGVLAAVNKGSPFG